MRRDGGLGQGNFFVEFVFDAEVAAKHVNVGNASADHLPEGDSPLGKVWPSEEEADEETAAPAKDFIARLNPDSLKVIHGFAEPYLAQAKVGDDFQFLRMGYFCKDKDSTADMAVFNRVVPLKDSYKPQA